MKKRWFTVQALAETRAVQVAIRGLIGEWGLTDRDFIQSIDALGEFDEIAVTINSRGGEVDHALSIFNYLRNHPAKVTVRVDGVAMSAASIVMLAGDEIELPANAVVMIHSPWAYAAGTADDLRSTADGLDTFEAALIETYMARTGKAAEDIKAMLDAETYMTAAEAVEAGFADRVLSLQNVSHAQAALAYAEALNIPAEVLARALSQACGTSPEAASGSNEPEPPSPEPEPGNPTETMAAAVAREASARGLSAYAGCFALDAGLSDMEQVRSAMDDAREILALCELVGRAESAEQMIRSRTTLAVARAELQRQLAEVDEASHTDPVRSFSGANGQSDASPVSTAGIWEARRQSQRKSGRA